jgi:L-lactate dehydrogenase complex protein LldE
MAEVGLFVPCYVDQLWPRAGQAAALLLEAAGVAVEVADAVCCGQVFSNAGDGPAADRVGTAWEQAYAAFAEVVVLSASCAGHLLARPGRAGRVREFCEFYAERAPARFPRPSRRVLALHTSCSALRETRSAWAAKDLLRRVDGLAVVEPRMADECCGFGGSFAASFASLSVRMGRDKVNDLLAAAPAVDGVVSADCSCMLHLRGLAPEAVPFWHVAEVLLEAQGIEAA